MQKKNLLNLTQNSLRKLGAEVSQARIGQDRSGISLRTSEVLKFNLDHALARDAIQSPWHYRKMIEECEIYGFKHLLLSTKASNREKYLQNPTLGGYLSEESAKILEEKKTIYDLAIIVTDGLSCLAVEEHFLPFFQIFQKQFANTQLTISPIIFTPYGRVALSDQVGSLLNAKIAIICVGERPGLSSADSMGIYLTCSPRLGLQNSDRNCISNIRPPYGLSYIDATSQLCHLITKSLELGYSGSQLKLS